MRIAIVNDLALARAILRRVVESVPGYAVAWEAADGAQAVTKAATDRPDVVLMDLMMPVMDGAEATRRIMSTTPCPVLVVTSTVGGHHAKVYEALGAGGLDAVHTPTLGPGNTVLGGEPLLNRLAKIAAQKSAPRPVRTATPAGGTPMPAGGTPGPPILVLGASTGGPEAIAQVLTGLGPGVPATVIAVQHIGGDYASGLADWLKSRTGRDIRLAVAGQLPTSGGVHLIGGDHHFRLSMGGRFEHAPDAPHYSFRPSVDIFFESLVRGWPGHGVAVLLTGMRTDGAVGLLALRRAGWTDHCPRRGVVRRLRNAESGGRTPGGRRSFVPRQDRTPVPRTTHREPTGRGTAGKTFARTPADAIIYVVRDIDPTRTTPLDRFAWSVPGILLHRANTDASRRPRCHTVRRRPGSDVGAGRRPGTVGPVRAVVRRADAVDKRRG